MMTIFERAKELLSPRKTFGLPADEISKLVVHPPKKNQMILRMMLRSPTSNGWQVPQELEWLFPTLVQCNEIQESHGIFHPFAYVTVRHGPVVSKTDDLWHLDGFSMRIHQCPEQNYIWTNRFATEVLHQKMRLPVDFDGLKHNIHHYIQDHADSKWTYTLRPMTLYVIDPYVIHRRPNLLPSVNRTFFRISFTPIEIEDNTCTINPLIPRPRPYERKDIRASLIRYQTKG